MKVSVSKCKTVRGSEGLGFSADLLADGVKVATVTDDGDGGAQRFEWSVQNTATVSEFVVHMAKRLESGPDFGVFVEDLVNDWLEDRRMERLRKTNVLFRLPKDPADRFRSTKHGGKADEARAAVARKYPDAKFL